VSKRRRLISQGLSCLLDRLQVLLKSLECLLFVGSDLATALLESLEVIDLLLDSSRVALG
jgi:hypothetical protein